MEEHRASYESLKIAHDYDEAEVRRLRPLLAKAEDEIARLRAESVGKDAELAAFRELTCCVEPGEHGEGVERPATPKDVHEHMEYLQREWDRAEQRLATAQADVARLTRARDEASLSYETASEQVDAAVDDAQALRTLAGQLVEALRRHKCCAFWSERDAAALAAAAARLP